MKSVWSNVDYACIVIFIIKLYTNLYASSFGEINQNCKLLLQQGCTKSCIMEKTQKRQTFDTSRFGVLYIFSYIVEPYTGSKYRQFVTLLGASAGKIMSHEARRIKEPGSAKTGYHARLSK